MLTARHEAENAMLAVLILAATLFGSVAILLWLPAVMSFGCTVTIALCWCRWLEEHSTVDHRVPSRLERS
jgi:hypothetical protein